MFISSLPCCKCKIVGYTQAAHVYKGGMGMKGHDYVIPLCTIHYENGNMVLGCHEKLDRHLENDYWVENLSRAKNISKKVYGDKINAKLEFLNF